MKKIILCTFLLLAAMLLTACSSTDISDTPTEVPESASASVSDVNTDFDVNLSSGVTVYTPNENAVSVTTPDTDINLSNEESNSGGQLSNFTVSIAELSPVEAYTYTPAENAVQITVPDIPELSIPVPVYTSSTPEFEIAFAEHSLDINIPEYITQDMQGYYIQMADNMTEVEAYEMADMSIDSITLAAETQFNLVQTLTESFSIAGLDIQIDPISGRLSIDSSLLYDTDEYEVTAAGRDTLSKLMQIYCSVLSQDEYRDFVSKILVIGHTDTSGTYDYNQTLSEKRANSVMEYCLSDECGIEDVAWLKTLLAAEGRSYDEPIYTEDGSVDMDASRRVEILFFISLD